MFRCCGIVMLASLLAGCVVQPSSAAHHQLQAVFSMSGIKGDVTFTQTQVDGNTSILVNLTGNNETLKWSIQQLPMIYDGNAALSCSAGSVGETFDPKMAKKAPNYSQICGEFIQTRFEACAIGDLGRMLGDLTANRGEVSYANQSLIIPVQGPNSIMGRTLVFYKQDGVTPRACALITPVQPMRTAVAVFKAPVAGHVYLRQVDESSDTAVFVNLFTVDSSKPQGLFKWQIDQGVVSDDFTDSSSYCNPPGEVFNPRSATGTNCNQTNQNNCPIGDLTSKHGNITVFMATQDGAAMKAAFTDTNLPLFGDDNVIGKSIVLFSASDPSKPVACAKILEVQPRVLKASFQASTHQGVRGYFQFTQRSPFDPTTTEINLSSLEDKAQGYHVHAYPSPMYKGYSPSESCAGIVAGDHWNPFGINIKTSPASGSGTDDQYEIGDLSGKYGSFLNLTSYNKQHIDYNLPMFGRNSIQGRSVVVHKLKKDGNKRWVCNNLIPNMDATSYVLQTCATFSEAGSTLSGVILIDQYKSSLPNVADQETTTFIDVTYTGSNRTTTGHRWDIHLKPVDSTAEEDKRCSSLQENFNPFEVTTSGNYSSVCSPTNMLSCELGDLSGKYTKFTVGGGRQVFNDVNLPLFGRNSVIGRGVAVRAKDSGSALIGCADIVANSSFYKDKTLEFATHSGYFDESVFVNVMSHALSIPAWRIFNIRKKPSDNAKCLIVTFGIAGKVDQTSQPIYKLDEILKNNPEKLEEYQPSDECTPRTGASGGHVSCIFSVVMVAVVVAVETLI